MGKERHQYGSKFHWAANIHAHAKLVALASFSPGLAGPPPPTPYRSFVGTSFQLLYRGHCLLSSRSCDVCDKRRHLPSPTHPPSSKAFPEGKVDLIFSLKFAPVKFRAVSRPLLRRRRRRRRRRRSLNHHNLGMSYCSDFPYQKKWGIQKRQAPSCQLCLC